MRVACSPKNTVALTARPSRGERFMARAMGALLSSTATETTDHVGVSKK
jgi:hypothetical protein